MSKKKSANKKDKHLKQSTASIDKGLEAIYGEEKVDFSKLEKKESTLTTWLFRSVLILGAIAIAAWGSYFVYQNYFQSEPTDTFVLEILHEEEITSGATTTLTVNYANNANIPIAALEIDANLPKGFIPERFSVEPSDLEELSWNIGALPGRSDGMIEIEGKWIAQLPSTQSVQVLANYKPSNFNSEFQAIETVRIDSLNGILETTFDGPESLNPGDVGNYSLVIANPSSFDTPELLVVYELPDTFFLEESDPAVEPGQSPRFTLDSIPAGDEVELTFAGSFASESSGFEYVNALTYFTIDNERFLQNEDQLFSDVLASQVNVQLVVNGSTSAARTDLGEDARMTIAIENTGDTPISDMSALLDFQAEDGKRMPIVWNQSDYDGGVLTSDGVRFSSDLIGTLEPGDKTIFNVRFPIKENLNENDADRLTVILHAERSNGVTVRSKVIPISLSSSINFLGSVTYHDAEGNQIGSGPLPPIVSEPTTYQIKWQLTDSIHDMEDIRIEATLAPNVEWQSSDPPPFGSLTYEPNLRRIVWDIDRLPANQGFITATAMVTITPSSNDTNSFASLYSAPSMIATDAETDEFIQVFGERGTTDIESSDPFNTEDGIVQER